MADIRADLYAWLLLAGESRGRLLILERYLTHLATAGIPGAVTEFGGGSTTAWMRAVLDASGDDRPIHTDGTLDTEVHDRWNLQHPSPELPDRIALAYLTAPGYEPTLTHVTQALPRLHPGAHLILAHYTNPDTLQACNDFFGPTPPITVATHPGTADLGVYRHPTRAVPKSRRPTELSPWSR